MLNNVVLMGRLTADPELRHTPNDAAVTSFTLAVERSYVKAGDERQVDFIDIAAWRKNGRICLQVFPQGPAGSCAGLYSDPKLHGQRRQQAESF